MQQLARGCALLLAGVSIYSIYLSWNEFVRQTNPSRGLNTPKRKAQRILRESDFRGGYGRTN